MRLYIILIHTGLLEIMDKSQTIHKKNNMKQQKYFSKTCNRLISKGKIVEPKVFSTYLDLHLVVEQNMSPEHG